MRDGRSSAGRAFGRAEEPARAELIRQFLLAQGWAGLSAGDHLKRLQVQGLRPEEVLWWLPGQGGEVQAVALMAQGRLGLLVPTREGRPAAQKMIRRHLAGLHRVMVIEGQLDCSFLGEFAVHEREVAVAPQLGRNAVGLPSARPARPEDADELHRIYDQVSWMRQDSPELWAELLEQEPAWVAELGGRVIAAARWSKSFGPAVEIGGVATHPDFRRRGGASAATLAATGAALERGLLTVLRYGDPELGSLYHPLGFQSVGRELVFYRSS
jgi:GNAT superfamily N-acetyltransferase